MNLRKALLKHTRSFINNSDKGRGSHHFESLCQYQTKDSALEMWHIHVTYLPLRGNDKFFSSNLPVDYTDAQRTKNGFIVEYNPLSVTQQMQVNQAILVALLNPYVGTKCLFRNETRKPCFKHRSPIGQISIDMESLLIPDINLDFDPTAYKLFLRQHAPLFASQLDKNESQFDGKDIAIVLPQYETKFLTLKNGDTVYV